MAPQDDIRATATDRPDHAVGRWVELGRGLDPEETVVAAIRHAPHDYNVPVLVEAYQQAVRSRLGDKGFALHADTFYWRADAGVFPSGAAEQASLLRTLHEAVTSVDVTEMSFAYEFAPGAAAEWAENLNLISAALDHDTEIVFGLAEFHLRLGGVELAGVDRPTFTLTARDLNWTGVYDPAARVWTATSSLRVGES